ncbi:MAG: hypothetical protein ABIR57_01060 [Aeromicrobium sp.]
MIRMESGEYTYYSLDGAHRVKDWGVARYLRGIHGHFPEWWNGSEWETAAWVLDGISGFDRTTGHTISESEAVALKIATTPGGKANP